jgi:transcription antitermination factor NusG
MTPIWYTLTVIPGYEEYVQKEISSKKYLKTENIVVSKSFSGYVFIKTDLQLSNLSKFFEIEGTINFLGRKKAIVNGKKVIIPEEISKSQITKILATIENSEEQINLQENKFKVGDEVLVKYGDLSGIRGKIVELKKRTVRIQSDFFQSNSKLIRVNVKDIEAS